MNLLWHYKEFDELTSAELYEILSLRVTVFMVEQDCLYNEVDGKDPKCSHLWCTMDGKILAYCRIVPPGVSYEVPSFGRVVSHPEARHLKLGHQLMRNAIEIIQNHFQTSQIKISAQTYLKNFYAQYGFEQTSEEYLEDGLPHMEMLRN
ncbi:GNAT family N-acetyltransferase [Moheibacter lacus]|uniref:GNAT family N-acetyltransferase n=1 Tax=Moheibacter lacus TaxID=2745851 RepID=A0A838ZJA7_9FLAO|nr:GNAT family N-acetyltransferase [Moheibacter lacus]MBA5629338.1 GNAT family N-acetyltransferase [Moheibacter lacus]